MKLHQPFCCINSEETAGGRICRNCVCSAENAGNRFWRRMVLEVRPSFRRIPASHHALHVGDRYEGVGVLCLDVVHKLTIFPVSYTHLDVYKRQQKDPAAERIRGSRCIVKGGDIFRLSGIVHNIVDLHMTDLTFPVI